MNKENLTLSPEQTNFENVPKEQPIDESMIATKGLSRAVSDETFYMNSSRLSLERARFDMADDTAIRKPVKSYDPFDAIRSHMSEDKKYVSPEEKTEVEARKVPKELGIPAINGIQEFAGQTHNIRSEKLSVYELKIFDIEHHFEGYALDDKELLEAQLASVRMTRGQKNVIRHASRELKHLKHKRDKVLGRLNNTALGK